MTAIQSPPARSGRSIRARGKPWIPLRAKGLARFEAGDFAGAREFLAEAVALGTHDPDAVSVLSGIYAEQADHSAVADLYELLLDRGGPRLSPAALLDWQVALFDAITAAGTDADPDRRAAAAIDLLAASAAAGAWTAVLARRDAIEAACMTPLARLDLLEQYGYAPEVTGLPASAAAQIEALGRFHAGDPMVARAAERLLHDLGLPEAAYGVERARRATSRVPGACRPAREAAPDIAGLSVLIAGGHPALRALVAVDLSRAGVVAVREIPPKWEGVRPGREVRDRLAGVDVAVLIGRRVAHSTADQVRSAASRLGVPVIRAETASAGAVRRAVEAWARHESP